MESVGWVILIWINKAFPPTRLRSNQTGQTATYFEPNLTHKSPSFTNFKYFFLSFEIVMETNTEAALAVDDKDQVVKLEPESDDFPKQEQEVRQLDK